MAAEIDKDILTETLSKISIFHLLPIDIIRLLADKIIITECSPNELIIEKGGPGDSMYVVLKGTVRVHDQEHTIAKMGERDFFGELSLFDSEPRSMSVSADDHSVVGMILRDDFIKILNDHPGIVPDVIKVLSKRLRRQNQLLVKEYEAREEELKKLVAQRTAELQIKNEELTKALDNLERSQTQLVQQAKLASLGQLTAGIAHEIQNPLNFVLNFSIVSQGLLDELGESTSSEDREELLSDLKQNLSKINQHGKRADSIVKNMLNHSRLTPGEKQPTDINGLCEEFLNLAYLGIRGNNPEFNCTLEKNFNKNLPKLNVSPQEISRVLLNLYNNAFYSVNEKKRKQSPGAADYHPQVSLSTQLLDSSIAILVRDNGTGIPEEIREKIFQPFFTTKPAGEGTGLGLSMSYDIVKSHGGEIRVESEKGKFTEFKIILPL